MKEREKIQSYLPVAFQIGRIQYPKKKTRHVFKIQKLPSTDSITSEVLIHNVIGRSFPDRKDTQKSGHHRHVLKIKKYQVPTQQLGKVLIHNIIRRRHVFHSTTNTYTLYEIFTS